MKHNGLDLRCGGYGQRNSQHRMKVKASDNRQLTFQTAILQKQCYKLAAVS